MLVKTKIGMLIPKFSVFFLAYPAFSVGVQGPGLCVVCFVLQGAWRS